MGIIEKLQELGLNEEYASGSFVTTIGFIDIESAKKIKNYLAYYGVTLSRASELKYFLYNDEEIKRVLVKLQYCKNNGIPVVDENGNVFEYLMQLDAKNNIWNQLYPNSDLDSIVPDVFRDQITLSNEVLQVLDMNATVGITDDETFERYVKIEKIFTKVLESLYGITSIDREISNNIIKLMSATSLSDTEIVYAVLVYKQNRSAEELDKITSILNSLNESLNQGGPSL